MDRTLDVTLTQDRFQKPLAEIRNNLGNGAYMTPDQMRALAHALMLAADACEARPMGKRSFMSVKRSYSLDAQEVGRG